MISSEANEFKRVLEKASSSLTREMLKGDMAQNSSKQEIAIHMRCKEQAQKFMKEGFVDGRILEHVRHLGARFSPEGRNKPERLVRIKQMKVGWIRMGDFWHSKSPWKVKRLLFIVMVKRLHSGP